MSEKKKKIGGKRKAGGWIYFIHVKVKE